MGARPCGSWAAVSLEPLASRSCGPRMVSSAKDFFLDTGVFNVEFFQSRGLRTSAIRQFCVAVADFKQTRDARLA